MDGGGLVKFVDVIRADASDIHSPMQSLPLLYSSVGRGGREKHELAASQALNSSSIGDEAKPEAPLVLLNPD